MPNTIESTVEAIQARREARRKAREEERALQAAVDLEALDAAEIEHGDAAVARVEVPYETGLPTFAIARRPKQVEYKRYLARLKERDGKGDPVAAAEEIAAACRIYPAKDVYDKMVERCPGLHTQLGVEALKLASGQAVAEGKS